MTNFYDFGKLKIFLHDFITGYSTNLLLANKLLICSVELFMSKINFIRQKLTDHIWILPRFYGFSWYGILPVKLISFNINSYLQDKPFCRTNFRGIYVRNFVSNLRNYILRKLLKSRLIAKYCSTFFFFFSNFCVCVCVCVVVTVEEL